MTRRNRFQTREFQLEWKGGSPGGRSIAGEDSIYRSGFPEELLFLLFFGVTRWLLLLFIFSGLVQLSFRVCDLLAEIVHVLPVVRHGLAIRVAPEFSLLFGQFIFVLGRRTVPRLFLLAVGFKLLFQAFHIIFLVFRRR